MLLLGVRKLIESIPKLKTNEAIRESNLSSAYIDSVLNPIFTAPDKDRLLIWSNTQVLTGNTMQPDFVVSKLTHSNFCGPLLVENIKGEDHKEDIHDCLVDLIHIGKISGSSINENEYDGIVGVHVVGLQLTLYITTLMANGIYVMLEICSVTLPRDFTEMRSRRYYGRSTAHNSLLQSLYNVFRL
ncbi:hypothetical protein BY458DRAFT_469839 [Sporodiniella umbellata]|nr:hypothetical protein BY458DRAFT_469839 [Sporodiniella umbellata]